MLPPLTQGDATLRGWLVQLAERFESAELSFGHGTDNAWDEAVALSLGALKWPDDSAMLDKPLSAEHLSMLEALATKRIVDRVPVPLLLGRAHFAGLEFITAPGVMIPRSPIAQLLRASFQPWLRVSPTQVLDVCCGGGCIGISVADQFPDASVTLSDIDSAAVSLAKRNVEFHQAQGRVEVVQGDIYSAVGNQRFDLIVSNPPYVPSAVSESRPAEFMHEPTLAYDGGDTGMALLQPLLAGARDLLSDNGLLVIEVGQWREAVEEKWPSVPFIWPDLSQGGEGVLVLDAAVVAEHTARFNNRESNSGR